VSLGRTVRPLVVTASELHPGNAEHQRFGVHVVCISGFYRLCRINRDLIDGAFGSALSVVVLVVLLILNALQFRGLRGNDK
jgi:hypothetical protein